MIEAEFVERLLLQTHGEGRHFIPSIYSLLDELSEKEIARTGTGFACHEGCSFCCNQMVVSTSIEWEAIQGYILARASFRETNQLFRRAKRMLPEWRAWLARNHHRSLIEPTLVYRDWLRKPCVFLSEEGKCSIYPVRTIDCRSVASDTICVNFVNKGERHRFAFPWYQWANNLILDEDRARGGIGVTPLIHLLDILMQEMGRC